MSTKPNSPPSERSAETRQRILDAALREFAANGLAGARTETIATAAGVNKALIYYYFESKEKLYAGGPGHDRSAGPGHVHGGVPARRQPRRAGAAQLRSTTSTAFWPSRSSRA